MQKVFVSAELVGDAYKHFAELYYPATAGVGHKFWNFVKLPSLRILHEDDRDDIHWMLPEETAHYVRLLAGPHYITMAKAMEINGHDYKTECPKDAI